MIKQYEMVVDEDHRDTENVIGTSLVENPATHKLFAVFSDETPKKDMKFMVLPTRENPQMVRPDKEDGSFRRIISGVWFMPDTDYPRVIENEQGEEEVITVSMNPDELMTAVRNFAQRGAYENFNIMHGEFFTGFKMMELWMLYDYNQMSPILLNTIEELGYIPEEIPLGTVFMTVYIEDEQFFNEYILSGKLKGFSIEGFFNLIEKETTIEQTKDETMMQVFNALGLQQSQGTLLTDKGKLTISQEDIKLDDETVEDGTYKLGTGFTLEIRQGKVVDFGFEVQGTVESAPVTTQETTTVEESVKTEETTTVDTPTEPVVEAPNVEETTVENNATEVDNTTEVEKVDKPIDNTLADQLKTLQEQLANIEAERATEKEANEALQAELKQFKEKELKATSIPVKQKQTTNTVKTITKTVGGKSFEVPVV